MAFFTDETRKWKSSQSGNLHIKTSPDGTKSKVADEKSGRSLFIEQRDVNRIKVTDENNKTFVLSEGIVRTRAGTVSDVTPIQSTAEFGFTEDGVESAVLDNLGVIVRFDQDGSKSVFFEDIGHRVHMPPHGEGKPSENHPGRFFHKISFKDDAFKEWDIHPAYATMFAKLVVAKDLNIEPGLEAQNEIDEKKAAFLLAEYLKSRYDELEMPEAWKANAPIGMSEIMGASKNIFSEAEKPWDDTTEFGGYNAALPNRFFITKTDDGFDLTTSSDAKHSIWAQGALLRQARNKDIMAIQTVNDRTATENILHMLNHGHTTEDHLGREWRFVVLQSAAAQKVVGNMNSTAQNALAIDSQDYAAISFDNSMSLLAMEAETLERETRAFNASTEVMRMIWRRDTDSGQLQELMEMGANYRYIDPAGATKGRTFSDVMKEHENYELLTAMRDTCGVHPDMPDMDDLDEDGLHL